MQSSQAHIQANKWLVEDLQLKYPEKPIKYLCCGLKKAVAAKKNLKAK